MNELEKSIVCGYEWNNGLNYKNLFGSYINTGFQSTNFGKAVNEINKMIECRSRCLAEDEMDGYEEDEFLRRKSNCTIFFGYETASASGVAASSIKFLVEKKMIDCLVTTPGSVEQDILFSLQCRDQCDEKRWINADSEAKKDNDNDKKRITQWICGILDEMLCEQNGRNFIWTPSTMIAKIGLKINDTNSICFWAAKNKIPIFCPEITNGEMFADAFLSQSQKKSNLVLDIIHDVCRINTIAMKAVNSSIIVLGSGIVKHHLCKTNCVRDGADFAIYINEALEYDGSDSGAQPDESVACGKIKASANPVKIHADPNIVFPFLVAETFFKAIKKNE